MTIVLSPQELQREILDPRDRIVIPTGAKRSGGTCGSFPSTHTPSKARRILNHLRPDSSRALGPAAGTGVSRAQNFVDFFAFYSPILGACRAIQAPGIESTSTS